MAFQSNVALDDADDDEQQRGQWGSAAAVCSSTVKPLSLPKLLMMHAAQRTLSKLRHVFAPNWTLVRLPVLFWIGVRTCLVGYELMFTLATVSQHDACVLRILQSNTINN